MKKIEDLINESNIDDITFHLEYYEHVMDMMEKRGQECDLREEYEQLLRFYQELQRTK